jgi:hypothetical protein
MRMSQFQSPFDEPTTEPRKTSGLAITSLVCSLIFCVPLVTPILGIIFGIAGILSVQGNPRRKGMGLAVAGLLIGLIVGFGQLAIGYAGYKGFVAFRDAPVEAMQAGFSGDLAGFKTHFGSAGQAVTDAEAQAFIDELRNRYGEFQRSDLDFMAFQGMQPIQPGQTVFTLPWVLVFDNGRVVVKMTFDERDQRDDQIIFSAIQVVDEARGDLFFPAKETDAPEPADAEGVEAPAENEG